MHPTTASRNRYSARPRLNRRRGRSSSAVADKIDGRHAVGAVEVAVVILKVHIDGICARGVFKHLERDVARARRASGIFLDGDAEGAGDHEAGIDRDVDGGVDDACIFANFVEEERELSRGGAGEGA